MKQAWVNIVVHTMNRQDEIIPHGGIVVEDGKIIQVGTTAAIELYAKDNNIACINGAGKGIFPGFINTHTHLYQELLKGRGADMSLENWWPQAMAPAGLALRERHVKAGVRLGIAEAYQCGVTTIVDYMQLQPVSGLGIAELEVAKETGVRMVYGRGYRDDGQDIGAPKGLFEDVKKVFEDVEDLKRFAQGDELLSVWLAPAAVWGLTLEGMMDTVAYSNQTNTPITMHMLETNTDNIVCQKKFGVSAIEHFEKTGLLGTELLAVHSVALDSNIVKKYKEYDVRVSYNPVANMYLASGAAPISEMLENQIIVGLGTDGAGSNNDNDLISAMKMGALLQKVSNKNPLAVNAYQMVKMSTIDAAKSVGLEDNIGSIEVGKAADFIVYNPLLSPKTCPYTDMVTSLVYSGDCRAIESVFVCGKQVYHNGEYLTLDYAKTVHEAMEMSKELP